MALLDLITYEIETLKTKYYKNMTIFIMKFR